ncbi:beta-ketoacyl synthase N-terminal-like domain-containing protein, partial [Streptomyces koyangensis]
MVKRQSAGYVRILCMSRGEIIMVKNGLEIAVIGMAGRFPGASNVQEYWDNLCRGDESIT